jgi:hypothetical protein
MLRVIKINDTVILVLAPIAVVILFTIPLFAYIPFDTHFWDEMQNACHALLFTAISVLTAHFIYTLLQRFPSYQMGKSTRVSVLLFSFVFCLLCGVAIEIIQGFIGRDADPLDVLQDMYGTTTGLVAFDAWLCYPRGVWKKLFVVALMPCFIFALPARWYLAQRARDAAFPVIADFDNASTARFVKLKPGARFVIGDAPSQWSENHSKVATVVFADAKWPGIAFTDVAADWSQYKGLYFEVFSPAQTPLKLGVLIKDQFFKQSLGNYYDLDIALSPGAHAIFIPLHDIANGSGNRPLNLTRMSKIVLYVEHPNNPVTLYFDNLKLE